MSNAQRQSAMEPASARKARILVVEDSPTQLEKLRFLLEEAGFSAVAAANGREALAAAKANAVDLVISDIVMPEMDGHALCKAVRADETLRHLPVILLTSLVDPRDVIQGLESGANSFICKPYDDGALLARVQNVITNQEIRGTTSSELGISVFFAGQRFFITADRLQILDLLLSTYENAVSQNAEVIRVRDELRTINEQLEARVAERTATLTAEIGERERTEVALRKSEERQRSILRTAMDGFWVTDAQGRILEVNETYCRMSGYSAQELLAMSVPDLEAAETADETDAHIQRIMAHGDDRFESRHRRKDGGLIDVEVSVQHRSAEDGHLVVFVRDITEHKRAEKEMLRLRQAVDASSEAIYTTDREGLITFVNPGFTDLYGFTAAEVVGRTTPRVLKSGVLSKETYEAFWKALLNKQEVKGELVNRTKDGRLLNIEGSANAVLDDKGQIVSFLAIQRDITERKQAEAEIRQLNEGLEQRVVERTAELEATNEELESFSYSVSHDLRAPLRAIGGFAEILARRYRDSLDEKGRHYLDTIVDSSNRMGILIEELLDYSRLGRNTVRAEPVPLGPLVTGLRSMFGERMAASGVEFEVVEPLAVPLGDPMLLERILANLVDNALTYRRPDVAPHVTLSATRHGATVTVAVADNGIGIPAEHREKVFEVFARLHTEEEYPGTGIGLSIVRKVARLMDGDVTIESTNGVGSTFSLELPAAQERRTPS